MGKLMKSWRSKPVTAQGRLILVLIQSAGGVEAVSKALLVSKQTVSNWIKREVVPLTMAGIVSRYMGVSVYAFNYEGSVLFLGDGPSWRKMVSELLKTKMSYGKEYKMFFNMKSKLVF